MADPHAPAPCVITAHARHTWYLIAAMALLTLASLMLTGVSVDPWSNPELFVLFGVLFVLRCFYRYARPDLRLQTVTDTSSQILLILLLGILMSYAAAATTIPLRDAGLQSIDTALGFDRRAYFDFFKSHPWLYETVKAAYFTMMPQFAVVPLLLFMSNKVGRLQLLIFAIAIALLVTDGISVLTPSVTTVYLDHGLTLAAHASLPSHVYTPLPTLEALRSGGHYAIRLKDIEGLISFPSFHTTAGLLFAWALWPLRYVRWLALATNAALIAAAPMIGAHYFIDLAGGAAVAVMAVAGSRWLSRRALPAAQSATAAVASPQ